MTLPAIRFTPPSHGFTMAANACALLGHGLDEVRARPEALTWAAGWLRSPADARHPPPLRRAWVMALLRFLDNPRVAGEPRLALADIDARREAIVSAILESSPTAAQLEYVWRRLGLPRRAEAAVALATAIAAHPEVELHKRPWLGDNPAAVGTVALSPLSSTANWLLRAQTALQMMQDAVTYLHATEAPDADDELILGRAALINALEHAPASAFTMVDPASLLPWLARLSAGVQRSYLNCAFRAALAHGAAGHSVKNIADLDSPLGSGTLLGWARAMLGVFGSLDGWGVWEPGAEPSGSAWLDLGDDGQRLVHLLRLYDAIEEILKAFRDKSGRPERAEFWRQLRPWISDARLIPRNSAVCILRLPGGFVVEFGEAGNAAYFYRHDTNSSDAPPLREITDHALPFAAKDFKSYETLHMGHLRLRFVAKLVHSIGWESAWLWDPSFKQSAGLDAVNELRRSSDIDFGRLPDAW